MTPSDRRFLIFFTISFCFPSIFLSAHTDTKIEPFYLTQPRTNRISPFIITGGFFAMTYLFWDRMPREVSDWQGRSLKNYQYAYSHFPDWDKNFFLINVPGHPLLGGEAYLLARNRGYGVFGSFLFSTYNSLLWEYGIEACAERPSTQDIMSTSTVGAIMGEVRYLLRRHLKYSFTIKDRRFRAFLIILIDPVQSLNEALSLQRKKLIRRKTPAHQQVIAE